MSYVNTAHISIQEVQHLFYRYVESLGSIEDQATSPITQQLEIALANTSNASFKIIHPLLIRRYRMPTLKFKTAPLKTVGLDIETNHTTGKPMLLGFWHPDAKDQYHYLYRPTLKSFFEVVKSNADNSKVANFITWGNLDIQCIIRLFDPDETERNRISRGLSANIVKGEIKGSPPVMRQIGKIRFFISHYIPGRSLKLGYLDNGHERTIWIFNCSQFYPGTIEQTAKGLNLDWKSFDTVKDGKSTKDTHLVDWSRFERSQAYKFRVLESNKQDARIVNELADNLQTRFNDVFECYPSVLVSTGSLTDAAVSKMLASSKIEYQSNSWKWLAHNVWNKVAKEDLSKAESLMAECFSAGYVDQFALGYFESACTADIAAAYPDKIRQLPDLRYSNLFVSEYDLENDLKMIEGLGWEIETAMIRGRVTIPDSLKFHPITVKTFSRENHRPTGEFYAAYTLDERRFCEKYGATFTDEQYVIIGLSRRVAAPIATVSEKLGEFRNQILAQIDCPKDKLCDRCRVLDGQQYIVKVIDNSIYGKTVMTTEVVEDIDGTPQITGYVAGDRFNPLYGTLITARTRIQIAEACMRVQAAGGKPIMTMTDSLYWFGTPDMLPDETIRHEKTPGFFETPEVVSDFYLLKTGQYEYRKGSKWFFKMRGLNVDRDKFNRNSSLYRRLVNDHCRKLPRNTPPDQVVIRIKTRRLVSVGSHDLSKLAMIAEGITDLKPFVMSSKQTDRFVTQWIECLDGHIWLQTPKLGPGSADQSAGTYPLTFLRNLFEGNVRAQEVDRRDRVRNLSVKTSARIAEVKRLYAWSATELTQRPAPPGRLLDYTWQQLEAWYGIPRDEIVGAKGYE